MFDKAIHIRKILKQITSHDDQHAFRELFDIYYDKIFKVALSIIRNTEQAEEIAEDVFFNFWQIRERYAEIRNVDSYLFISAKNLSLHYLKKNKGFLRITSDVLYKGPQEKHDPEQVMLTSELERYLDNAVEKLPPKCKEIFKLVRIQGLKYKEVAGLLDISVKTVENQIAIALKKLHTDLDMYYTEQVHTTHLHKIS